MIHQMALRVAPDFQCRTLPRNRRLAGMSNRGDATHNCLDAVGVLLPMVHRRQGRKAGKGLQGGAGQPLGPVERFVRVIECKDGVISSNGISKAGQLGQSVAWFEGRYPAAVSIPIIVHPERTLGQGPVSSLGCA